MQPAKFSVCLGFIALCFVTVAMVTAPFSEKRRGEECFLTSHVDFPAAWGKVGACAPLFSIDCVLGWRS
jgi:hypothetical protein